MKQKLSFFVYFFFHSVPAKGLDPKHFSSFSHSLFLYFLRLPSLIIHITKQKSESTPPKKNLKTQMGTFHDFLFLSFPPAPNKTLDGFIFGRN